MSVIDEIKDRLDVVDLIGESVKLRRTGKNYIGFCPFHANTRTPAFVVFPESGTWRCFGACNEGGDIFKFVMKKEGLDFPEALRRLAQRAGVELKPRTPREAESEDALDRLRSVLESASAYYHHLLLHAPQAAPARELLAQRGLTESALRDFQIGYALDSWDAGLNYLKGKGCAEEELKETGLLSQREGGGFYDRFRNRILFPIRDARGRLAGFGGRVLNPEDLPKFLNSPETALFHKGALLYGLDRASKAIRESKTAVLVEGYMDVIAAHQAGYRNVVSPMGTALTEAQLRQLKKSAHRVVLALDPDEAGSRATQRGLEVAGAAMTREAQPVFDPRGLIGYEGRLKTDIRVLSMPGGLDPDEYLARHCETWPDLVAGAQPIVEYVISVLTQGRNLADPKVKSEIISQALPLIEDVADPAERDTYRQKLARVLRLDERTLMGMRVSRALPRRSRARPGPQEELRRARPEQEAMPLEAYCLGALVRDPGLLYKADRALAELGLARMSAEDFALTEHQLVFRAVQRALEQVDADPAEHLREKLDDSLRDRLETLRAMTEGLKLTQSRVITDVLAAVLRLRRRSIHQWLGELRFLTEDAQAQPDGRAELYSEEILKQTGALAGVDQALGRVGRHDPGHDPAGARGRARPLAA